MTQPGQFLSCVQYRLGYDIKILLVSEMMEELLVFAKAILDSNLHWENVSLSALGKKA